MARDPYFGNRDLRQSFEDQRKRGDRAESAFLERSIAFDPMAAVREFTTGAFNDYRRQLGMDMESLRGRQVGAGRLKTGFGFEDQDRLVSDSIDRLNDKILQQSMWGAQLGLQNTQNLGAYGQSAGQEFRQGTADLLASREAQRMQDKASKRSMWSNILGGALGGLAIAFSDETLKTDVEDAAPVLPRARRLRGKSWRWNLDGQEITGEGPTKRRHGVMAQDVETVFPELVEQDPRSGKKRLDYGGLASTLVNAIAELDDKIETRTRAA